jgi:hypothetical protein
MEHIQQNWRAHEWPALRIYFVQYPGVFYDSACFFVAFMERKTKNIAKIAEKMGVIIILNASVNFGV